jgi:hypothetical protein
MADGPANRGKELAMPTVMSMRWTGVTPEQYEAARKLVDWETNRPDGGMLHIAAFTGDGLRVVDLWESAEQFNQFVESRLMPGVKQIGIEGEPEVELYELHNMWAPHFEGAAA